MNELKYQYVWDAGTRWFHWINAVCVFLLIGLGLFILNAGSLDVSNSGKVILKTVHTCVGYVLVVNLFWRFVWAFRGNQHARWRAILPGGRGYFRELAQHFRGFSGPGAQSSLGHNPAGKLAVAAMLLLLTTQALTGLFLAGSDIFYPPIGHWIAEWIAAPGIDPATLQPYAVDTYDAAAYEQMRNIRKPIATVHLYSFYALAALVILHLIAVVVMEIRNRNSIISAMFTGYKTMTVTDTAPGRDDQA
jgi:Ni/Fe-hydrogenase 1 B-type cytochrome subunit